MELQLFLGQAVPVPDGAWEECHSSVVIPTKFPCQLSVVRESAGTSPRALGTCLEIVTGAYADSFIQNFVEHCQTCFLSSV